MMLQTLMIIRLTLPDNGNAALRGGDKETTMHNVITLDVLKTLTADELEDYRAAGEDYRRELSHAVMRDLPSPSGWSVNAEYKSEFGGFFPVQLRFTPSHGNFHIAVCSPGDINPSWMVVFIPASGRPFSVISTLPVYSPEDVSHTLSLAARLDADGYSHASIIGLLEMEGAL